MHKVKEISSYVQIKLFRNERNVQGIRNRAFLLFLANTYIYIDTLTLTVLRQGSSGVKIHKREDIGIMLWP